MRSFRIAVQLNRVSLLIYFFCENWSVVNVEDPFWHYNYSCVPLWRKQSHTRANLDMKICFYDLTSAKYEHLIPWVRHQSLWRAYKRNDNNKFFRRFSYYRGSGLPTLNFAFRPFVFAINLFLDMWESFEKKCKRFSTTLPYTVTQFCTRAKIFYFFFEIFILSVYVCVTALYSILI